MFSETDIQMMRFALEEARIAFAEGEIPVGAVVADGERVLARAHNRRETDADPCAHAEILALRKAAAHLGRWRLQGLTLYVTLEPCPMCAGAAEMSGLARVVYGAKDAQYGCCGSVYRLTEDPAAPPTGACWQTNAPRWSDSFFKTDAFPMKNNHFIARRGG